MYLFKKYRLFKLKMTNKLKINKKLQLPNNTSTIKYTVYNGPLDLIPLYITSFQSSPVNILSFNNLYYFS